MALRVDLRNPPLLLSGLVALCLIDLLLLYIIPFRSFQCLLYE